MHPDYIFLDWNMGRQDGATAIKSLRQEKVLETTPIFIVSLLPPLLNETETGRLGIKKIIRKQGSIQEFGAALSGAIEYQ